jgi:hypothetical protein
LDFYYKIQLKMIIEDFVQNYSYLILEILYPLSKELSRYIYKC